MSNIYLISDTHFGHFNIIRYCNRPFVSVKDMDDALIHNINNMVKANDTLYHLGDFCMAKTRTPSDIIKSYVDRISCKNIIMITGDHDPHYSSGIARPEFSQHFKACYNQYRIKVQHKKEVIELVLNHYSMRVWRKSHYGTYHAYGHSHGQLFDDPNSRSTDVGVDATAKRLAIDGVMKAEDYRPLSIDEFLEIMSKKTWTKRV